MEDVIHTLPDLELLDKIRIDTSELDKKQKSFVKHFEDLSSIFSSYEK